VEFPKGGYLPVFRLRGAARASSRRETVSSIAVLPFTNLTPDSSGDYFSDGLAEELNLLLTRVQGLRVVAWHSAAQMRGREEDLREIRERLKVRTVLKGAVRRTGDQVRVTVQLIDTGSGAVLWSDAYSRAMSGMFGLQEEIARAIVDTLRHTLGTPRAPAPLRAMPSRECYDLCLQGRFHANKRTGEGLRKSAACFAEAAERDPACAAAYAGLADAYNLLCDYAWMRPL
jgi:serine/threonine-protein kinase